MTKTCFLCKSSEDNELLFGRFYSKWKLTVHYYCLLLSSNLVQRGNNDTVGIFGFLESDVRKENERTKKCRCYICKDMHANVSCCSKKCLRTFHTVCGIMNGCLSHYTDTYQSWCSAHVPLEPESDPHSPEEACSICYDEMGQYDLITSIRAPCCRNGWFHQRCLARYAESAGYFFKCPLCKNEDKFVAAVPLRGVFVPERDAAWELEPNAFQEQLQRPTACDAEDCKCAEGRTMDNRQWQLVICGSCGSTCRHRQCMEQATEAGPQVYLCQLCQPIVGEQTSLLEKLVDSSDSSDDDTASTSSSVPLARRSKHKSKASCSGEEGVHCSSSDEPLANIRRLAHTAGRRVSDASDSERSDGSSIQIRRFVRQNTGKRVRRLLSDGSDNEKQAEDMSDSTDTLPMRIDRSPVVLADDGSSDSSDGIDHQHVVLTRQLARRLSSQSDSSKCSTIESTNSNEILRPKISSKRRARIASSSDESEKKSEGGNQASDGLDYLSTEQRDNKPSLSPASSSSTARRLSSSSKDSYKRSDSETQLTEELDDELRPGKNREPKPFHPLNGRSTRSSNDKQTKTVVDSGPTTSASESDEKSTTTDKTSQSVGRSPSKQETNSEANASEAFSKRISNRRTRQLIRRHSVPERSTSESSVELKPIKPKRTRISALLSESSEERTEENRKEEAAAPAAAGITTDKLDCAPRNKRRRLSRARSNQSRQAVKRLHEPPEMISPPSTPSSLSSEASQQPVTAERRESLEPVKHANRTSRTPETQNRQQQSMLQFITVSSAQKATVASDDSTDHSAEETVSPLGNSIKIMSGKNVPISSKPIAVVKPKRRRTTNSPKKKSTSSPPATVPSQCAGKQQSPTPSSAPTSSKAAATKHRTTPPNRITHVHQDKGQKNILNYFNRC